MPFSARRNTGCGVTVRTVVTCFCGGASGWTARSRGRVTGCGPGHSRRAQGMRSSPVIPGLVLVASVLSGGGCVGCGSMPRRPERDPGGFPGRVCLPACASLAAEGADGQDGTPGTQGLATAGGGEALRTRWVAQGRGRVSTSQSTTRP